MGYTVEEQRHSYTAMRKPDGATVKLPVELTMDRKMVSEIAREAGCSLLQLSLRIGGLARKR